MPPVGQGDYDPGATGSTLLLPARESPLSVKCPKCGYAKNAAGDRLCSLCGEVLAPGGAAAPAKPAPAKKGADPGDTEIPEPAAPAPAASVPASASDDASGASAAAGGLCHLKCSLLDRPLRMRPDRAVTIGRARECDISVPSQMVSRTHGKVEYDKGVWVYTDLKSSNGSRINGKRVERAVLQSGDVIDVGGFMITYKEIHDLSDVSEVPDDQGKTMSLDPSMLKRAAMSGMDGVALLGGLGGTLADIAIFDILQLLETQRKTGTLTFDFEGAMGKIHMVQGAMVHAEYGKLTGELAVQKMLVRTQGTFHFDPREPRTDRSIHRPTTTVLMDAARSFDERGGKGA